MSTPSVSSESLLVSVGVQCHVGKQRTENQDRVTRASTPYGELFVVADGMGGYEGGAEAAQATVDGFIGSLNANPTLPLPDALQQAARGISAELQQRSEANPALHGMGSTVVLCVVNGNHATYAHAGDSRLYLLREGQLLQLTRDHSVMERLVAQGTLTGEQAREHPDASILTRAIGQGPDVSLDIAELTLQPHDALLLCSDGLWGYAQANEMEAVALSESLSPSAIAVALLDLALEGGGGDNVSIQFLRFEPVVSPKRAMRILGLSKSAAIMVVAIAVMLAAIAGVAIFVGTHSPKPVDSVTPSAKKPATTPQVPHPTNGQGSAGTEKQAPNPTPARKPGAATSPSTTAPPSTGKPANRPQTPAEQPPAQPAEQHSPLGQFPEKVGSAAEKAKETVQGVVGDVPKKVEEKVHPSSGQPTQQTPPQSTNPASPQDPQHEPL